MAQSSPASHENPPHLATPTFNFNVDKEGRKYGLILGAVVSVYLLIVNQIFVELPMSVRFAKHLLIIPIVWYATKQYAEAIYSGNQVFKAEIGLMFRIGMWATGLIAVLNIMLSAINPALGFEQFLNDNNTFGDAMMNSFFVAMETLVFVVIIGFVFMQYYKRGGSPED
ncbi:ABC-type spermidine/putrescine transport system permease subunit II [Lewinella marina]|uniref:Uncharacterized protein n=1 Tax=Neolewinella marina TaxID=438751 RepID=A0A2G0CI41_9BACT|nr:hypothetical protein [Neolewinella marina]NJB85222.1 ABC-type spermidine/putrescine transport system permease subunit II [Neolewinella marina]PHK99645.1 hypothetical protein CGL56_00935 [Neolewinella marina]